MIWFWCFFQHPNYCLILGLTYFCRTIFPTPFTNKLISQVALNPMTSGRILKCTLWHGVCSQSRQWCSPTFLFSPMFFPHFISHQLSSANPWWVFTFNHSSTLWKAWKSLIDRVGKLPSLPQPLTYLGWLMGFGSKLRCLYLHPYLENSMISYTNISIVIWSTLSCSEPLYLITCVEGSIISYNTQKHPFYSKHQKKPFWPILNPI